MREKPPLSPAPEQPSDDGDIVVSMEDYIGRHPWAASEHPKLAEKILGQHDPASTRGFFNDDEADLPDPPDDSPDGNAS